MAPSFVLRLREKVPLASLTVNAPAKLNLYLRVTGRRADGYHTLDSLFHTIGLYDRVDLTDAPEGAGGPESNPKPVTFTCSDKSLAGEDNLACIAARKMIERAGDGLMVRIHLQKNIPAGAGLGGGSSDAAAVLTGLNRLWKLGLTTDELSEIAAQIGSDVPFFVHGGAAQVTGRGEVVTPVKPLSGTWCVLVYPGVQVSTAEVFRRFADGKQGKMLTQGADASIITSARSGTSIQLATGNDLQETACRMEREIALALSALSAAGAEDARMSGSGASVFCLAPSQVAADGIRNRLKAASPWSVWVLPLVGH